MPPRRSSRPGCCSSSPLTSGSKSRILASLTVVCAFVPLIERASQQIQHRRLHRAALATPRPPLSRRLATAARKPAVIAAAIIAVGAAVDTAVLTRNKQVILIERGQAGARNAQ